MVAEGSENKRIAKNTAILYVRMLVMMFISFFTSRVMLNALGVDDYGINNVVGGLVSMFSLLSSSLSSSTSRFITFGLGQGDMKELKKIFSTTINIHIIIAIVVVIAIETMGVWFLNNKMNIPLERLYASNWVLQCSVVVFAVGLLSVPYNSAIIAHEKMTVFAYITIIDAVSKLAIVFAIYYYEGDRLILFSVLMMFQSVIRQLVYWIYCKQNFQECVYIKVWDKKLNKSIFGFAGWNFIGASSAIMKDQGVNIAINLFTSPAVNAARGIAMQINGIINQFIGGFTTALNPQITKNYAFGDLARMHSLIFQGTRLSYYLFMFLSIPVFFEIEIILNIWLGQVPEHTILYARLILILSLTEILSYTLITAQLATGKIRNYQLVVGGLQMMNFPISYLFLYLGFFPEVTIIIAIIISQLCLFARLWFLRGMIKLSAKDYLNKVYTNVMVVTVVSLILPFICYISISHPIIRFFSLCTSSVISSLFSIYYLGCSCEERKLVKGYVIKINEKFMRK